MSSLFVDLMISPKHQLKPSGVDAYEVMLNLTTTGSMKKLGLFGHI